MTSLFYFPNNITIVRGDTSNPFFFVRFYLHLIMTEAFPLTLSAVSACQVGTIFILRQLRLG